MDGIERIFQSVHAVDFLFFSSVIKNSWRYFVKATYSIYNLIVYLFNMTNYATSETQTKFIEKLFKIPAPSEVESGRHA